MKLTQKAIKKAEKSLTKAFGKIHGSGRATEIYLEQIKMMKEILPKKVAQVASSLIESQGLLGTFSFLMYLQKFIEKKIDLEKIVEILPKFQNKLSGYECDKIIFGVLDTEDPVAALKEVMP